VDGGARSVLVLLSSFLLSTGADIAMIPFIQAFFGKERYVMNAEAVGESIIEAIIKGNLCYMERNGSEDSKIRWVCTATEQVGHRALEISGPVVGHMRRKLNAQADTIGMLHEKLAQARTQRACWKKEAKNLANMVWLLAEECVDRLATDSWTDLDKGETVLDLLETVGFNIHEVIEKEV